MNVLIAVLLSVLAGFAYAGAAVLQERVAHRPLTVLLRTPAWWVTIALNAVGALLHVASLRYGPLSLVQPLGVLTLVLAVPIGAMLAGRRVSRGELRGIALTIAGLSGILLLVASSSQGIAALTTTQFVGLLLATAAVLAALGFRRSGLFDAAAAGVAFGVSSALTQTLTLQLSGFLVYGAAIAALTAAGTLFTQRSYRDGLGAPLAVSTLANPIAAAAIGFALLGEGISGGLYGTVIAVACGVAAAVGVVHLTRVPVRVPVAVLPRSEVQGPELPAGDQQQAAGPPRHGRRVRRRRRDLPPTARPVVGAPETPGGADLQQRKQARPRRRQRFYGPCTAPEGGR